MAGLVAEHIIAVVTEIGVYEQVRSEDIGGGNRSIEEVGSSDPDGSIARAHRWTAEQPEDLRIVPRTIVEADPREDAQLTAGVPIDLRVHLIAASAAVAAASRTEKILAKAKRSRPFLVRIGPTPSGQ